MKTTTRCALSDHKEDFYRASGQAICYRCDREYIDHPMCGVELSYDKAPYLHVLCNGDHVKL